MVKYGCSRVLSFDPVKIEGGHVLLTGRLDEETGRLRKLVYANQMEIGLNRRGNEAPSEVIKGDHIKRFVGEFGRQ